MVSFTFKHAPRAGIVRPTVRVVRGQRAPSNRLWWRTAAIRAAVRKVLIDPSYRANAKRMQAEIAALPGPEAAVTLLEGLRVG